MYSDGTHIYRAVPRLNLTATEIQPLCCGKLNIFQHLVDNVSPHETRHGKPNASPEAKAAKRATLYYIEHILFNDKSNFYHKVASKKLMSTIYSRPPAILQQLFINLILKWCRPVFFTRLPCSAETERSHWCAFNLSYSWIFRLMGGVNKRPGVFCFIINTIQLMKTLVPFKSYLTTKAECYPSNIFISSV